jgi:type I restriction-modification system DNA methylase subunit
MEELKHNLENLIQQYEQADRRQSEADVRANYIDWLFFHLGWDVWEKDPSRVTRYQREGYIRGAGYVDVGLEILGEPVLMLEAKRFGTLPSSGERNYDRTPEEKQLFRYAHRGKKIPYCILTNFERLHVFNADHERLILAFDSPAEYLEHLPELMRLSPEKVKAGSLPAWERQLEIKDVDEAFLASLQEWRKLLANAIYRDNLNNPALQSNGSLDFTKLMQAVQRVLDRLILIRYADDQEVLLTYDVIESILAGYRKKGNYAKPDDLMRELIDFSHRMDEHHNTSLFQPGHICEQVAVPNEVLEKIMTEMNNISFRKFTSDVLGSTYETYLGTKLVLKNGEIKSEERRDIRKAGGIYYTPPSIVHYIVDNTLGKLLDELESEYKLDAIRKAKEIRVLDPACGSGSFLIYAYRLFSNFYRRINEMIDNERVRLLASAGSTDMFQRLELFKQLPEPLVDYPHHILEEQLFGVDIDPEAAEISAVNLTMQAFADAKREKLPLILNENIKVGNSLISGTEEELRTYFGDTLQEQKPFNWGEEFPDVMSSGRFDVVVGNPPYIDSESMVKSGQKNLREFISKTYKLTKGNWDIYIAFFELGLRLLHKRGMLAFITPDKWISKPFGDELRKGTISSMFAVAKSGREVFKSSNVDSIIPFFSKSHSGALDIVGFEQGIFVLRKRLDKKLLKSPFSFDHLFSDYLDLLLKVDDLPNKLSDLGVCENACATSDAYKLEPLIADSLGDYDGNIHFKVVNTGTIGKYFTKWGKREMTYLRKKYLHPVVKKKDFFSLFAGSYSKKAAKPKIIIKGLNLLDACLDTDGSIIPGKTTLVVTSQDMRRLKFLLGILNSRFVFFYIKERYPASSYNQGISFTKEMINNLPLPRTAENEQNPIVSLVDSILLLTDSEDFSNNLAKQDQVKDYASQIDQLVYQLYHLTPKEKSVVKNATKNP